jgi:hypothetical protein
LVPRAGFEHATTRSSAERSPRLSYLGTQLRVTKSTVRLSVLKFSEWKHVGLLGFQPHVHIVGKKAGIIVKLVDDSLVSSNDVIAREIFKWLHDALSHWVKEVDCVFVHGHSNEVH